MCHLPGIAERTGQRSVAVWPAPPAAERGAIRVLVADAQAPARAGVRLALEDADFVVCPEADSAHAPSTRHRGSDRMSA